MATFCHRSHDHRKLLKVLLLRGQERRPLKKGNHAPQRVVALSHNVHHCTIVPSVGLYVAGSAKPPVDQLEHLAPVTVLADMKLRDKLKPCTACRVTVDGDCKAALAIYKARDVAIQPFLLIVRTRHIFTVPPTCLCPTGAGRDS